MRRVDLMGCPVDALTMAETVAEVERIIRAGVPRQHMAVNAAKIVKMTADTELRRAVLGSALINADGASVVYASRFLGQPLPERVAGIDLLQELLRVAPSKGWRPYFLGARQSTLERFVERVRRDYPGLDVAGYHNGYFTAEEEPAIAEAIRDSGAHMLFVAMSSPKKEIFCARWLDTMNVPFVMGVGGSIDVMSGELSRAPRFMREHGLEWAWRTILEPRRMWRRSIVDSARFVWMVVQARLGGFRLPREIGEEAA